MLTTSDICVYLMRHPETLSLSKGIGMTLCILCERFYTLHG